MAVRRARLVRNNIESARERQFRAILADQRLRAQRWHGARQAEYRRCLSVFPGDFLGPVMRCTLDAPHEGLPHDADGMIWSEPKPRRIWWKPRTW